ncbi:MAG: DUF3990 domain-containing protein [Bacteroides sp.]|nr:DUF3990 domain-containing protein [Prevotella sp.]MCM1407157.1 DUF3990 domain-containing protein [Treponema brennaborense]MCM1470309.1 DUF3990 domain-containing protein [Bacteroides sp.]
MNELILYHGSKNGIKGGIAPISRDKCDFGKGFYMGTEKLQPLTLVCSYENAVLYTVHFSLDELKVLEIPLGIDWALFVAYNRGLLDSAKNSNLYKKMKSYAKDYDVIKGYIANDRMFVVLDRFFGGTITDAALVECLSALKLGEQYAAITHKACGKIKIVQTEKLAKEYKNELSEKSAENREKGISLAEEICRKHRRNGMFFDEILEHAK